MACGRMRSPAFGIISSVVSGPRSELVVYMVAVGGVPFDYFPRFSDEERTVCRDDMCEASMTSAVDDAGLGAGSL